MDTGAEVSIISERVFHSLPEKPPTLEYVTMKNASQNSNFKARRIGPVDIQIKNLHLRASLYVGPISDEMLIGFSLLKTLNAKLDIGEGNITLKETTVSLEPSAKQGVVESQSVQRLVLTKPLKVPAWSEVVTAVPGNTPCTAPLIVFEPSLDLNLPMARTVCKSGANPIVSVINCEDQAIVLPVGTVLGTITPSSENQLEGVVRRLADTQEDDVDSRQGEVAPPTDILAHMWQGISPEVSDDTRNETRELVEGF